MVEIELKFQVPAAARTRLRSAVATATARTTMLAALYFDTPDQCLARAGIALRLRREGRLWVQTCKGRGDGLLARLEHEVARPGVRGTPALDLSLHDGTPAGDALRCALGAEAATLAVRFETRVRRIAREVRSGGARIELALDIGELRSGDRRLPLHEIEFELKAGPVEALFALAARWVPRHGLWLDVRSKAERGERLARGWPAWPPAPAPRPLLDAGAGTSIAVARMLHAALEQVLPNAAELADRVAGIAPPADAHDGEHLHQWRVGVRRLRSVLREFGETPPSDPRRWDARLAAFAAAAGTLRDRQALADGLLPVLHEAARAAGAPPLDLPPPPALAAVCAGLVGADWTVLMLELMSHVQGLARPAPARGHEPTGRWLAARLDRLHDRLRLDAAGFDAADDDRRHEARKRLKRLRYALEGVAGLQHRHHADRMLEVIRAAQDELGLFNDLATLERLLLKRESPGPAECFALGWMAGRRPAALGQAAAALRSVARARPGWRRLGR